LLDKTDAVIIDCQPFQKSNSSVDYAPRGDIANSKFNGFSFCFFSLLIIVIVELDTLRLFLNGSEVPVTNRGISWSTDHDVKFQNPSNAADCKFSKKKKEKKLKLNL